MEQFDKKYYKIKEVSEITGLPASTLRFWESQFSIIAPRRNEKGTRFYTSKDIENVRMVQFLIKTKGLKIEAAQEQIKHNPKGITRQANAVNRLMKIREELNGMLEALNRMR